MSHTDDADYTDNASLHSRWPPGYFRQKNRFASCLTRITLRAFLAMQPSVKSVRSACDKKIRDVSQHQRSACKNMSKFMCHRVDHYPHVDLLLSTEFKLMTLFSLTECFMSHADYADYTDNASLRSRLPSGWQHQRSACKNTFKFSAIMLTKYHSRHIRGHLR